MHLKPQNFVIAVILAIFVVFAVASASNIDTPKPKVMADLEEKHYPPIILDSGGPDGGGYYFIDSDDAANNAPVYEWIDITGIGTPLTMTDDNNQGPFNLGFTVTFYGTDFTSVRICSNGWLSFTSTTTSYSNSAIPSSSEPNNLLALWWDDLDPAEGGMVYYYSDPDHRRFIVSYESVVFHYSPSGTGSNTVQAIIYEDGTIIYQYAALDPGTHGLNSATVGIENSGGDIGTQYLYNQEGIHNEMAVYFGFTPPIYGNHNVGPLSFIAPGAMGQVDDPITPIVRFANIGQETETFPVRLIIERNSVELYNETEGVHDLPSAGNIDVSFPVFTPDTEDEYILTAISELDNDENRGNDTLAFSYLAFEQIVFYDFESNGIFSPSDNIWEWGTPTSGPGAAHSGVNVWGTVLSGNYPNGTHTLLETLPFGLSANAVMGFWQWYDTEASYDGGNVKISTDGGSTWVLLQPDQGYTGTSNTSNPLYPDPIFTGHDIGEMWHYVTFDLAAYAGQSAIFRFDFGSDGSVQYPGWYIDDFTVLGGGGVEPGWISGVVRDNSTSNPLEGAVVNTGGVSDVTGADGIYVLEVFPGSYDVTATAQYHNPATMTDIVVVEDETTYQDFALMAPMMQMDDSPMNVQMPRDDVHIEYRDINNTGDGVLDFNISIAYDQAYVNTVEPSFAENPVIGERDAAIIESKKAIPEDSPSLASGRTSGDTPVTLDFGDEIAYFNLQSQCGDNQLLGVAMAEEHFWVSGGNGGNDPNNIYKFDINGLLVDTYSQGTTSWGWLDLGYDGEYIYGTDYLTDVISTFDPVTGQIVGTVPNPTASGLGITYDPATDHFWGVNWWGSNIIEFDRSGQVINTYPQAPLASIFGLAWDNVSSDGPWLWCFSQESGAELTVAQFDPINGYMTGVQFQAIDHDGDDIAGGMEFTTAYDPTLGTLICLGQADVNDWLGIYEVTEANAWLAIDPMSGSVDPGESQSIEFTMDMTEVDDTINTLDATVNVSSNSPVTCAIDVHVDILTGIEGEDGLLPSAFSLSQNYPNPFNARTAIEFSLPVASDVDLSVYNMLGQKVATLISGKLDAGYHRVNWNANDVSSGLYFYKLTAGDKTAVHEMTLIK